MKKKISVADGTDYIGSYTIVELQNAGYEVAIIGDLSNSNIEMLNGTEEITGTRPEFIQLDLKDKEDTRRVLEAHPGIKGIILFAVSKAVGESVQQPLKYYRNNIVTLVNLLEMMPEFNIEDIVFSSSCTIHGQPDPESLSVTENAPTKPIMSPYGNIKQINEKIIQDTIYAGAPFKSIILRYLNSIGAHPSAEIGELPNGVPQSLIPYLAQTTMGIHKELSIFSGDHNTADDSCIRDYTDVVDSVKARVIAMDRILENKSDEHTRVFNLGTGNGVSILEPTNTLEQTTGAKVPHRIVGRREGDIEKVWTNPEHTGKVLGWTVRETLANIL